MSRTASINTALTPVSRLSQNFTENTNSTKAKGLLPVYRQFFRACSIQPHKYTETEIFILYVNVMDIQLKQLDEKRNTSL